MRLSPILQRALLLQEQDRHDLAEKEFRQHLASDPTDGFALSALANTLLELERRDEAEATAREAIGHVPDMAYAHYVMARVMSDRNRTPEALASILEAIRLEPHDADYHSMLAAIQFERSKWAEALSAAEVGLRSDPEHVGCNNLRAMALVKLGRKVEAGTTIGSTLARNPENAFSHANLGWTLMEQGKRKEAMNHFRESLRLDPTNDWARAGLVEAIKAGNPVYAGMLRYFLWIQKLPGGVQWGIFLGGYFGNRLLGELASDNPSLSPWITPIRVVYIAFALLTWLASPLFNLTLFLHPVGRHALSPDERWQARLVGSTLALALASVGAWLGTGRDASYLIPALVFGLLAMPVAAVFNCPRGWPRWAMGALTTSMLAVGLIAVASLTLLNPTRRSWLGMAGVGCFNAFLIGSFLSQWVANFLISVRPKR
jgi:tetratricopeptide (TPR) repeat protein